MSHIMIIRGVSVIKLTENDLISTHGKYSIQSCKPASAFNKTRLTRAIDTKSLKFVIAFLESFCLRTLNIRLSIKENTRFITQNAKNLVVKF